MREMHKKVFLGLISGLLLFTLVFGVFQTVQAAGPYDDGVFGAEEEVFDDLLLEGSNVVVAGTIHGMLFAFGDTITIQKTAVIEDDAFLFGQQIVVETGATLSGNVYSGAQKVQISADIARSLYVGSVALTLSDQVTINNNLFFSGFQLETAQNSTVNKNLYAANYQSILNGAVGQNLRIGAATVHLNGTVGGNAEIDVDKQGQLEAGMQYWYTYMQQYGIPEPLDPGLYIADSAEIGGQLIYTSPAALPSVEEGLASGGVVYQTPQPENIVEAESQQINITYRNPLLGRLGNVLRSFVTLILIGALLLWKLPNLLQETANHASAKPLNAAGIGIVSMLVVYVGGMMIFGLLIFFSVLLGILSLGGLGQSILFLGLASIAWLMVVFTILLVYGSKLVVAYWLGTLVMTNILRDSKYQKAVGLLVGILLVVLVSAIPFVGWLIKLAITLIGLGAMWYVYRNKTGKALFIEQVDPIQD